MKLLDMKYNKIWRRGDVMMSGLFTDLSWLHISRIIIRAGATGTAAHLVIVILTQSTVTTRQSLLSLTIRKPEAHSWSKACSRELCFRKYLEVYRSPSSPRSGSRLSFRVSCRHLQSDKASFYLPTIPTLKTSLQRADFPQTRILPSFLKPVVDMSPLPMANVPL